ncbi:TPA: tail fiber assembly protein, partial [Enterobacter chengduensis]|nr:tail fiber assembly protein [Enterobacter chengduensis]
TTAYWMITPPKGKILGVVKGKPAWVDIPPPTQEELIQVAEREKKRLINVANDFINSKQWPGKAAIKRLKDNELVQYNLWLDYLDYLESTDASTAPDIDWPEMPI